jgi:hypothetical protein
LSEIFCITPDARLVAVPIAAVRQEHAVKVGTPVALFATRLASGPRISLTGLQSRALYAVTSDGRFLMNITIDADRQSPIILLQNWQQLLKK